MRLILLLAAIAWKGFLSAQDYNVTIYTTSDGLPNSYIYSVFFDSRGYMWMGSLSGFCRYDGRSFTTFSTYDGLKDASTGFIYEDREANIWGTAPGRVYRFEHNRFIEVPIVSDKRISYISCLLQLDDGKIILSSDGGTFAFTGEKFEPWSFYGLSPEIFFLRIINLPGDRLIANTLSTIYEKRKNGVWQIAFDTSQAQTGELHFTRYHEGRIYFGSFDGVYELARDRKINLVFKAKDLHSELGDFFFDRNNNLWITTTAGGLYFQNQKGEVKHFGKKYGINNPPFGAYAEDSWGNIWIGSYQGLIKLSPSFISCIVEQGEGGFTFRNLYKSSRGLFFFGGRQGMYYVKNGQVRNLPPDIEREIRTNFEYKYITSITEDHEGHLWICTNRGEVFIYGEKYFRQYVLPIKVYYITFSGGRMFLASHNKLYECRSEKCLLIDSTAEGRSIFYITGMITDKEGQVWFCDREKLMLFKNDSVFNMSSRLKIPDGYFSKLLCYNNELWASSHYVGIIRIRQLSGQYKIIATLNKNNGLSDNSIQSFMVLGKNELWYTTSNGLHKGRLEFHSDSMFISFNRKFEESEGLRNTIWDTGPLVSDDEGNIWVAAVNGIYKVNVARIPADTFPPITQIEKADLLSKGVGWEKYASSFTNYHQLPVNPHLPYKLNSLRFSFKGITMNNAEDVRYKYKLEGYDRDWTGITLSQVATYTNLPANNYKFIVEAMNGDGVWSKPEEFSFSIIPPFWQTWWFRGVAAVVFILSMYYFIRRRELQRLKKNQLQLQVAELKLQTLQSQMNPHFIFNSLNSIQKFILEHNSEEGAKYLSKFSKLIRTILDNSRYNLLPLYQILETLEMYIELESLRFNKEFSYEVIKGDEDEIMNRRLPPMMLQPYVENAIWHGLMPKEGEKMLKVMVQKKNLTMNNSGMQEALYCVIEDNGVGRKKTPVVAGHISRGEKMTIGMTESLQQLLNVKAEIIITDLNRDGEATGTRIEIFIPDTRKKYF